MRSLIEFLEDNVGIIPSLLFTVNISGRSTYGLFVVSDSIRRDYVIPHGGFSEILQKEAAQLEAKALAFSLEMVQADT